MNTSYWPDEHLYATCKVVFFSAELCTAVPLCFVMSCWDMGLYCTHQYCFQQQYRHLYRKGIEVLRGLAGPMYLGEPIQTSRHLTQSVA